MPSPAPNPVTDFVGGAAEGTASERGDSTWRTAWRLVRFTASVDPRLFWVTLATSLAGSLAEGTGLVLLFPLLAVAGMNFGGSETASRLAAASQRLLVYSGVPHSLWLPVVLAVFLATGALRSVLRRSQSTLLFSVATEAELAFSKRVYAAVVNAQWGYLVRQRSGRLTHVLTAELRRVQDAMILLLTAVSVSCLTLLYLLLALKLSAPMTLLVLAMGGALMLLQRRSLQRMRMTGRGLYQNVGDVYTATEEHLLNTKSVKTYNAEDRQVQLFGDLCDRVARDAVESAKNQAGSAFGFEMGSLIALGAVIFLALRVLHVQPATMLLLLAIFTRLMPQLASLQSTIHEAAGVLPAYDHVLAIESECLRHADASGAEPESVTALMPWRELRLEDVWFAYKRGDAEDQAEPEFVLRGIDLRIEAGLLTAVIGPSGAGKSTIADLANGLLQPTRGQLLIDDRPLEAADLRQWRRQIGYVGQETVLFHQSVRENLLWARPDASDADLREAIQMAAADFVYDLPGGLESVVGDRGILLSSGQRQRISLARALLRQPTLLILDEATNALDEDNEARILDALRELVRDRQGELTVLMIAHRASAIRRADCIVELAEGRVTRAGTWQELNLETAR
ncbi:MAG: ABC transporter ATP-binding protein/permease [Acidobacteriota bacterium]|nr:ABC transporter ATP-binding protein/permease [Acidobacteriota bacterium]